AQAVSATQLRPESPCGYWLHGYVCIKEGTPEDALKDVGDADKLAPTSDAAMVGAAAMCIKKEYDAAIRYADRALKLEPSFALARAYRGLALAYLKNPADAFTDLDEAIKLDDHSSETLVIPPFAVSVKGEPVGVI